MITDDSLSLERADADVVRIRYGQIDRGLDSGGTLLLHRSNLAYVAERLVAACERADAVEVQRGPDHLRIYSSGADQQKIVNVVCRRDAAAPHGGPSGLMLSVASARRLAVLLREAASPPAPRGSMSEDLELVVTGGPPRYRPTTDKAVEHLTLATMDGAAAGCLFANDDDDAGGWVARPAAGPQASDLATPWVMRLLDAKRRGLRPTAALDELERAGTDSPTAPRTRVLVGSRRRASGLEALRALAEAPLT